MYKYFPKITFGKYFDTKQKEGGADVRQQADGAWIGSATVSVTPFLVVTALGVNLSAKHIETVAHVEHGI